MFRNHAFTGALAFVCTILCAGTPRQADASTWVSAPANTAAQQLNSAPPQVPQITQTINNSIRLQLVGNTDSSLTSGTDLGAVADSLPLDHMWLQLRRSSASEQALDELIDALHDPKSPSFHQWLTAAQYSAYGPAQSDINTVVAWLESEGFTVDSVLPSGMVIEFSGTAGDVQTAFGTQLHNYNVGGTTYLSNASDPSIPAALAPAVVGVVSLNNRFPHPLMRKRSEAANNPGAGMAKVQAVVPNFDITLGGSPYLAVAPGDFNTIYNVGPVWAQGIHGAGQTIVVIEDTLIQNVSDVATFRSAFGLSGFSGTFEQVTATGTATCNNSGVNGAEGEAALDAEWAGVAAPDAAIELASCKDTATVFGGLIAAQNLINSANPPKIMSVSYGECESQNGATANQSYVTTWQQAAAEGITVFVSSGDEGAASCDADLTKATHGIAVSGFTSTPYNVSVGGTDFLDTYNAAKGGPPVSTYWAATNSATFASALSYIPEIPWNDSCAGQLLYTLEGFTTAYGAATTTTGFCNTTTGKNFRTTASGSGGPSNFSKAKPAWQALVLGNPADGVRDIPDVSLFAANGLWNHFLVYCMTDAAEQGAPACDYTNATDVNDLAAGGTSFASPALAGIQALINQSSGQSWGNMNTEYYQLAAAEYANSGTLASCNSSNGTASGSTCIFHDVTQGDIDVNCTGTTAASDCFGSPSTTVQGVLSTSNSTLSPAYGTTPGWDFATGLGSVNVANLVTAMNPSTPFKLVFTVEPSASYTSKAPITVKVSVENLTSAVLTSNTSAVTLALSGGTAGATLGGTTTVNAVAGVATFSNLTVDKVGTSYVLNATDGSLLGTASSMFNITTGAASAISFSMSPSNAVANTNITPAIVAHVQDAGGNPISGDGVTLTIANNAGGAGIVLTGGSSVNTDSNGNATFSGVSLNKVGSGYTLTATDSSGTPLTTTSGAFNITAGAASAISFTTQPSNTAAGASITPAIVAHVQDAGGNPISGDGVTLTIANNAGGAGTGLTGGSSVNTDSNGNATFGGVSLNKVGTGYTLTATDSSGTPLMATSGAFNITAGAASAISFTTQPSNATAGASIAPAIVAHVQDAGGNAVSGDGVTLTIANNAGGAGTVLTGGSSVSTDGNGNATFSGVSLNKVGTSYTLTATDSSGTPLTAISGAFNITAGAASAISFATQPSNATAGANITPAIVVHVQDVSGNAVSGDGIVLAIGNNVGGSSLTGGGLVSTDSNGNATFSGVSLNKAGSGYTLQATDSSATPLVSTSSGFSISAAVPAVLTFSVQPSDTTAGVAISPAVQVSLIDAFGNLETGDSTHSVTLALAAGSDPTFSGGNAVTLSAGVATFPAVELTLAASGYKLSASTNAGAFTATSIAFSVNPAAVVSLAFNPDPPSNTVAGVAIPGTETVTESDQFGNVVTSDNNSVISVVAAGPGSLTTSPATATVSAGVASFNGDLILDEAGSYTLTASTSVSAMASADSQLFTVSAATGNVLKFTPAPGDVSRGQSLGNVTVTEYDSFGNQVLSDNSTSITLTAGSCGGTVVGTGVLTGGVATIDSVLQFHTLATGVVLSATAAGSPAPTPATSTFNVDTDGDFLFYNGFELCTP